MPLRGWVMAKTMEPLGLLEQPPIWEGREALLLPGGAGGPGSPCGLHWFCGEGREDHMCHPCLVGREIPAPCVSLSVTTVAGVLGCLGTAWWSLKSRLPSKTAGMGGNGSGVFCGFG